MAVSMNGFASAVEKGWAKTGKWRGNMGRMGVAGGRRMMGNSMRRMSTFSKMAANEGYWKAYQKALQGPMLDGAVKGAMIGAGLNTAQYLYNNSDRPDLRGAAGAAFRGAMGGGAVGGVVGGIGHFTGNPLTGRLSTRAARDLRAVNRAESAVKASRRWKAPKVPRGKFSAGERQAAINDLNQMIGGHRGDSAGTAAIQQRIMDQAERARRPMVQTGGGRPQMAAPGSFSLTGSDATLDRILGRPGAGSVRIQR